MSTTPTVDAVWLKEDGHLTMGTTIDDWRTPVDALRDEDLSFTAGRCVELPNMCSMVFFKSWAESGVAPTWKIGAWRFSTKFNHWTCFHSGIVTVTAGASTGGTALPMDKGTTLYVPLTHAVNLNSAWIKVADGDATQKVPGCIMFDPCGCRKLTFQPYHASSATKVNGQVSWW